MSRYAWLTLGLLGGMAIVVIGAYLLARYTIRDWGWAER